DCPAEKVPSSCSAPSCRQLPSEEVGAAQDHKIAQHLMAARQTLARFLAVGLATQFLEHVAGRRVVVEPAGPNCFGLELLERERGHTARRLARETLSPER